MRIPGYHGHLSSSELTEFEVKETLVIEIIEKIVDDSTIVYPFTDDEIAVIVQHRNAIEGQLKDAVRTLIENIRREVTHRTNIRVFTGYGGIYNSANLIGQSFTEARNAIEYQRITGTSEVTAFEDMPESQELFHYPPDVELRLLSSIQAGNIENLKAVLEEIGRINIVETTLRPFMLEGLLENLKATLLKGIGSIEGEEEKGRFVAEIKAALEAKRVLSFDELQVSFIRLTRIVNEKRAHHYDDLSAKIREYIDEHYADKDLSLSLIASRFQMTDTYVCKLFKTHTGQSLFGYIQNARMKKAMDMLADYGNTVEGVSLDCGYSNVSTFRRAFKRHTGVSPSDYRVKKLI